MKLAELIHPMSVAEFVRAHFETTPLHVKGPVSRFSGLFSQEAFYRLAQDQRISKIRCTFPDRDDKMVGRLGRIPLISIKASSLADAVAAGGTVFVDDLQRADERIGALCETLKKETAFVSAFHAAAWLSPVDSGIPFHNEGACTFLLQIEGTKIWRLSKKLAIQHPHTLARSLNDGSMLFDRPDVGEWEKELRPVRDDEILECKVEPGDFLFIPSGCWHSTRAADSGTTLSLNLYAEPVKPIDLLMEAVRPMLEKSVDWRRIPALEDEVGEGIPPALGDYFAGRLSELASLLRDISPHARSLERQWKTRLAQSDALVADLAGAVNRTDRLRVAAPVTFTVDRSLEQVTCVNVFLRGDEATFTEGDLIPFALRLLEGKTFVAADVVNWAPRCGWDDLKEQLEVLLANGFLERVPLPGAPAEG